MLERTNMGTPLRVNILNSLSADCISLIVTDPSLRELEPHYHHYQLIHFLRLLPLQGVTKTKSSLSLYEEVTTVQCKKCD